MSPLDSDVSFQGYGNNGVDRSSEGDLGERQEDGDEVGEHLVAVVLAQEGEGEDSEVGEDAESVEYAETGYKTTEGGFEPEICFVDHTEADKVAWKTETKVGTRLPNTYEQEPILPTKGTHHPNDRQEQPLQHPLDIDHLLRGELQLVRGVPDHD